MKRLVIAICALFFSCSVFAQQIVWDVHFNLIFDNHEYSKMDVGLSKTLFGTNLTPTVGLGWDDNKHKLNVGLGVKNSFGNVDKRCNVDFLAYYEYNTQNHKFLAGAFPTKDNYDDFKTIFISDEKRYQDVVLEGLKYIYQNERGYVKLIYDWSRWKNDFSSDVFSLLSTSRWSFFELMNIGYQLNLTHYAYDVNTGLVVDNFKFNPYVEFDFGGLLHLQEGVVGLGPVLTMQRDRSVTSDFIFPTGGEFSLRVQKWNVGLYNSIYFGDNLMPYSYYIDLYCGSQMYATDSGLYDRAELYYVPVNGDKIKAKLSLIMHVNGYGQVGWQQNATIVVSLDHIKWKSLKRK